MSWTITRTPCVNLLSMAEQSHNQHFGLCLSSHVRHYFVKCVLGSVLADLSGGSQQSAEEEVTSDVSAGVKPGHWSFITVIVTVLTCVTQQECVTYRVL